MSYARSDNGVERLREVRTLLGEPGHIYVDDLEAHPAGSDRVQSVVEALASADVFVAIHSANYLKTEWTRWEFEFALHRGIEMVAVLPSSALVRPGDREWPFGRPSVRAAAASTATHLLHSHN